MPRTKISEFSATAASNTDIDSINIAEGCAPSGINDAIRELMAQLKDFQTGAVGDSFNGPVGSTTAAAGAFTTLSASSTVSGTGFSTYLASPPAIGGTAAAAVSATTLTTSSTVTLNGGTANGVAYLNGSKVVTSGSALTFDGTNFATTGSGTLKNLLFSGGTLPAAGNPSISLRSSDNVIYHQSGSGNTIVLLDSAQNTMQSISATANIFNISNTEQMRLTSTGLGIGTSSPAYPLDVVASSGSFGISLRGRSSDSIGTIGFFTNNGATNDVQLQMRPNDNEFRILVAGARSQTFYTNGSERMRLDSSGNLGLGVTPSAWNSGAKAMQISTGAVFSGSGYAYLSQNHVYGASGDVFLGTGYATAYGQASGVHKWLVSSASGTAGNAITFTQAMTLDASGQLALGATSASGYRARLYGGNDNTLVIDNDGSRYTTTNIANNGTTKASMYWDNTNTYMVFGPTVASSQLLFTTVNTERARINSSGHFELYKNFYIGNASNTTSQISSGSGAAPLIFAINGTESARISTSGNLLVGTTVNYGSKIIASAANGTAYSSTAQLRISGGATNNNRAAILFSDDALQDGKISYYPAASAANSYFSFSARLTESDMILDGSGNLLVGTTDNGGTNAQGLEVYIGGGGTRLYVGHASGTANGTQYVVFNYNATQIGSISQSGTTAVLYNVTSDYRLKNNPQSLTGAKDFVMALQPKKWQWWDGSGEGVGFIAHEFMEVAKYSGNGTKDAVDDEGKPIMQSIQPSSSEVMANLVSLIQEQQAIIESLKTRLDAANL